MAIRDVFKISRKTFFNPTAWLDYDFLIAQNRIIKAAIAPLFTKITPEYQETFEQAIERQGLTEDDIAAGMRSYTYYAVMFFSLGLLIFFYGCYLLFRYHNVFSWPLAFGASALCCAQAFKYDFWVLQMRSRRLGLTFKDWRRYRLGGKSL